MKQYSKREFLKIMGLGLAFAPFISLYSACSSDSKPENKTKENEPAAGENTPAAPKDEALDISKAKSEDIILLKRTDAQFAGLNKGFNGRIKKLPLYIALCKTTLGVQYAIAHAKKEKLLVAVKSGGHSFEGFSNNEGGLVINLSQMKGISWQENEQVSLQPGCLLQEIQDAIFSRNRLIPTGSCGTVGIAGLTLGGGYGFFSRKYGLTCDNLVDIEFVDGKGQVQRAAANKELFWALRGGGNGNFGVATNFIFKTEDMPATFHAHVLKFRQLNTERFTEALKTWFSVSETLQEEDFCAFVLNGSTLTILATTFGNKNKLEQHIAPLLSIADTTSNSSTALPQAMKRYYGRKGPILFKNASAGLYKSYEDIATIAPQIFEKVVAAKGMIYQINTLGAAINSGGFEDQSCYPHRALPYLSELQAYWDNPSQEAGLVKAFEDIQSLIRQQGITAQYRNYPDINFPDWQHAYYGKNYERLQKIKQDLDPDNLFQYPQSIAGKNV